MKKIARFFRDLTAKFLVFLMKRVVYRVKLHYEDEKAPKREVASPSVVVSNHLYGMDGAMIACALDKTPIWGCIAKSTYENGFTGLFSGVGRLLPIEPDKPDIAFMREAKKILKNGESLLIFPEGESSHREHGVLPFKPGFAFISQLGGGVPVVPLYFYGNYARPFFRRFHIMVGNPVDLGSPEEGETAEEWRERKSVEIRDKVLELGDELMKTLKKNKGEGKK